MGWVLVSAASAALAMGGSMNTRFVCNSTDSKDSDEFVIWYWVSLRFRDARRSSVASAAVSADVAGKPLIASEERSQPKFRKGLGRWNKRASVCCSLNLRSSVVGRQRNADFTISRFAY